MTIKPLLFGFALLLSPLSAWAATYYGDTDGDGYTDTVTTVHSGNTGISIYHPRTGATRFYSIPGSFSVHSIVDTNGVAGGDVIVIRPTGNSTTNGISIVHDQNQTMSMFLYNPYTSFSLHSVVDTDGQAGAELVVVRYGVGLYASENGVSVINDRLNGKMQYYYDPNVSYSIYAIADTDGQPGAEIVVDRHATSLYAYENGISIIDDRERVKRLYWLEVNPGFSINRVANYDGIAGAEVCYNVNNPLRYWMIIDRTQNRAVRSGC